MAKAQRTGVIRDYDMHSASVRVGYGFIIFFCLIMTVIAVFPIIWVVLAGFKDLKEFMSSAKLLPEVFDFSLFAKTWSQLGIAQNYLNSRDCVQRAAGLWAGDFEAQGLRHRQEARHALPAPADDHQHRAAVHEHPEAESRRLVRPALAELWRERDVRYPVRAVL